MGHCSLDGIRQNSGLICVRQSLQEVVTADGNAVPGFHHFTSVKIKELQHAGILYERRRLLLR